MTNLDCIFKSRDIILPTKFHLVKTMVFPVVVWMWELDCKEGWAPKNWCFWTVVLEKMLESPLDCKELQPVHPKGNQSWIFIGRTDAEAEAPVLWPPDVMWCDVKSQLFGKNPDAGKDWGQERGTTENEMGRWHSIFTSALERGAITNHTQQRGGWGSQRLPIQWTWVWANSGR